MNLAGFSVASVSELVGAIKHRLEEDFAEVMVQGEVSNLSSAASGHWYFTLSDGDAAISCALFKGDALRNPLINRIKDGDQIVVLGPISVYAKRGTFQITAKRVMPAGEGQLKLRFEMLKQKLSQEGLFDLERKKPIPAFPKKIAVITAEKGAALQDFLNVYQRRSLYFNITIIPALVQGDGAVPSLIRALDQAEKLGGFDVVVVTRGGGSLEDLWAFNEEALIRRMDKCAFPIISAVGHQVDFTLSDYVADLRSETPTAAAETLTQPQTEILRRLKHAADGLRSALFREHQHLRLTLQRFHPKRLADLLWQRLHVMKTQLHRCDPRRRIPDVNSYHQELDDILRRLETRLTSQVDELRSRLEKSYAILLAVDPQGVLKRGYCYLSQDEVIITSKEDLSHYSASTVFTAHFHDGTGQLKVVKESP